MTVIVDNQACLRDIIAIGRHPGPDPLKLKAVETRIADYCRALRLRTREGPPAPSLIESLRQGMREIIAGELTRPHPTAIRRILEHAQRALAARPGSL